MREMLPDAAFQSGSLAYVFKQLWEQQRAPHVAPFLRANPDASAEDYEAVVRVDQVSRWQSGRFLAAEEYFTQLPELKKLPDVRVAIAVSEARLLRTLLPTESDGLTSELFAQRTTRDWRHASPQANGPTGDHPLQSPAARSDYLKTLDHLSGLPAWAIDVIEAHAQPVSFADKEPLIRQGEPGRHLLILVQGCVDVLVEQDGDKHLIDRDRSPSIVGEMSLLTDLPCSADVVARGPVHALLFAKADFDRLRRDAPDLNVVLTRLLAQRLGNKQTDALASHHLEGFKITRTLGQGGMSVVYQAQDESGRDFALKMLSHRLVFDEEAIERFKREAQFLQCLNHPNIVKMYRFFPAFQTYFIVMELCDGITLQQYIAKKAPLSNRRIRKFLRGITKSLGYAHSHGIIHRDLKPSNIMITREKTLKLMDFGIATPVLGGSVRDALGTPIYMAPEQLAKEPLDHRTDVYALGCILYELITGRALFQSKSTVNLFHDKVFFRLPPREDLNPELDEDVYDFMRKCLSPQKEGRAIDLTKGAEL